ncbi:hypothetical protein ACPPVT_11505 [Angustibacter sp. McL0619]|uniref:hypothetical protein n=1 Tax=Angustibacter sp. McL0619 TaxID=3415676 RepID=UPI003CEA71AA
MTTSPFDRRVRTDDDLREHWQSLMGPDGFGRRSLWLAFFDAGAVPVPTLVPIDDIPERPVPELGQSLDHIAAELRATTDVDSVAVLLTRPGGGGMSEADREWARFLYDSTALASRWPVHLGTAGQVRVFAPDDLIESVPQ